MIGISPARGDPAAFEPFRPLIAILNYQMAILELLIRLLSEAWNIKAIPLPDPRFSYLDNEGIQGYGGLVIPPLFDISPFFSRIR
ncbi:MAG: hypothetical protein ABFC24_12360 [Methanoregulaceae archaeon]